MRRSRWQKIWEQSGAIKVKMEAEEEAMEEKMKLLETGGDP